MGSLGPIPLVALILIVAVTAAICGFIAASVVRRNKRRARGVFAVGFLCGLIVGARLRRKRRAVRALTSAVLPVGLWQPLRHRRVRT